MAQSSVSPLQADNSRRYLMGLTLAALGVVFGDIGTSPLYALRECFHGPHSLPLTTANVLGILSLIVWSLILVISIKYLLFVMRADNRGEGGVLALMALAAPGASSAGKGKGRILILMGLFGASLLYGDGIITPAISVLGAVEGLSVASPHFERWVMPLSVLILVLLFLPQKRGTAKLGAVLGPIILVWFGTLMVLGIWGITHHPAVLDALNPLHAVEFMITNKWEGFIALGVVILAVTGAEALYADMGHFGRRPIRIAWYTVVLPGLVLNYLGQGALLLDDPTAAVNPFFRLAPDWALYPLVILSTAAAVIASQALISGAYSITRQAVSLGYLPRMTISHTSKEEIGQIYVPFVNWALMISTIWLVLFFQTSSNMAAAYGVAVTATMVITTILTFFVAHDRWHFSYIGAAAVTLPFLLIDLSFFSASMTKLSHGGWFPLFVGVMIVTVMTTWRRGRTILAERLRSRTVPFDIFIANIKKNPPVRVPGTAIFMASSMSGAPPALVHNVKHNKVLHETVALMTVTTAEVPYVPREERFKIAQFANGFYTIAVSYGFMDTPNVPAVLLRCDTPEFRLDLSEVTYFLGRETVLATSRPGMAIWRENLFSVMSRNAQRATAYFRIPPSQVVEIGIQIEL